MNNYQTQYQGDEISLRDLYLIIKQSFWLIVVASVIVGAAAFIYASMQPKSYTAEATTLITPLGSSPALPFGPESLQLATGLSVSYEAYTTLAQSHQAILQVLEAVPEYEGTPTQFLRNAKISKLVGPANATQVAPLSVVHSVTHTNPELAARLADAWSKAAIEVVRAALLDELTPVHDVTNAGLLAAEQNLLLAESLQKEFYANHNPALLQERLEGLTKHHNENKIRILDLTVNLRANQALLAEIDVQLGDALMHAGVDDNLASLSLDGLSVREALSVATKFADEKLQLVIATEQAIHDFDQGALLSRLRELESNLSDRVSRYSSTLATIDIDIQYEQSVLESYENALERTPPTFDLVGTIVDNPLLLAALQDREDVTRLTDFAVHSEHRSSVYESLTRSVSDQEAKISRLLIQKNQYTNELPGLEQELQEVRDEVFRLTQERAELTRERDIVRQEYSAASDLVLRLRRIELRPESDNVTFQRGGSTYNSLEGSRREIMRSISEITGRLDALRESQIEITNLMDEIKAEVADLQAQERNLQNTYQLAETSYLALAETQPIISVYSELIPGTARVLSPAIVPELPTGRSRMLITVIAMIVTGAALTMFVFLREAVREPTPAKGQAVTA